MGTGQPWKKQPWNRMYREDGSVDVEYVNRKLGFFDYVLAAFNALILLGLVLMPVAMAALVLLALYVRIFTGGDGQW